MAVPLLFYGALLLEFYSRQEVAFLCSSHLTFSPGVSLFSRGASYSSTDTTKEIPSILSEKSDLHLIKQLHIYVCMCVCVNILLV